MSLRDHLPLHWQGWLSEAEDGFGMALSDLGDAISHAGLRMSDRANERWERIQPRIQAAVREAGVCPVCSVRHEPDHTDT